MYYAILLEIIMESNEIGHLVLHYTNILQDIIKGNICVLDTINEDNLYELHTIIKKNALTYAYETINTVYILKKRRTDYFMLNNIKRVKKDVNYDEAWENEVNDVKRY